MYASMTDRSKRRAIKVLDSTGRYALVLAIIAGATALTGDNGLWDGVLWIAAAVLGVTSLTCAWVSISIELSR